MEVSLLQNLEYTVSILLFTYKVIVLAGKKTGWLLGAVSAALATWYFYLVELYVYTVLDAGLIVLMAYAFVKKESAEQRTQNWIRAVTGAVMVALATFAFSGMITIVELISSLGLLLGTVFLTHGRARLGWLLYAVAHALAVYLGYAKGQPFFADLQISSMIVSIVGVFIAKK